MRYLILLCLLNPLCTFAETSLWRVSKGESELFIGGTIHLLSTNDYPLPKEFEAAYKKANMIVFETNLQNLALPEIQKELKTRVTYKGKKTLKDDLNPETYKVLAKFLTSKGLSIEAFSRLKPPMAMITLLMVELQRLGLAEMGVDKYFNEKARADGKTLGELESAKVQLSVIENMGKGHEDEMILSTISEMKKLAKSIAEMKTAWRQGDAKTLEKIGIAPMKKDYPELYQLLLVKRNNAWVPKIKALLKTPEVELILVGALHLIGNDGVFSQLRALGYSVELFDK
ncbi:MAG: TraB/GumN family protein [Methylococcales bacterium]|nr:TraB/GumN family protein [Methylococcales bacterium]